MFGLGKKKKKNCEIGASCGASCIDRDNMCLKDFPPFVQKAVDFMTKKRYLTAKGREKAREESENKRLEQIEKFKVERKEVAEAFKREFQKWDNLKFMAEDLLSMKGNTKEEEATYKEDIRKADSELKKMANEYEKKRNELMKKYPKDVMEEVIAEEVVSKWDTNDNKFKMTQLINAGADERDAAAITAWISFDGYHDINKYQYARHQVNPGRWDEMEYINKRIREAAKILPKASREALMKVSFYKEEEYDKLHYPGNETRRGLTISDPEAFVKRYRDNIGGVIKETTNFAATARNDLHFVENANVVYIIQGMSNAITLDQYKNYNYEGEVFWANGQNFRVNGVRKEGDKYFIDLDEVEE
jgi:hypothetical protein